MISNKQVVRSRWNVASKTRELLLDEPGLWSITDHRADGTLLLSKATGSLTSEYWEWSPATKALRPVLGVGESEEYEGTVYGAAPGELLVQTPKLGEFRKLCRWDGRTLAPVTVVLAPAPVPATETAVPTLVVATPVPSSVAV